VSKIRHYRELAGMTQVELAEAAGIGTSAAVSNYEAGRRQADVHTLQRIRDALRAKKVRVSIEDLVDEPNSQPAA